MGALAPADVTAVEARRVYDTNVLGITRVTHAPLPLLRRSDNPVIVNVASGLGSFRPEMRVNVVDPGYTATDPDQNSGTPTVEQGTDAIVRLAATLGKDGPTGTFQDAAGDVPW